MTKFISLFLSFITVLGLAAEGIPHLFKPTLEVDAAVTNGDISTRATGYLYGIAQNGVPDKTMVESIDVSSVSQKVIGGLQHPIGDVDEAAQMLDNCDYITVYLQDCFDTWYYCHEEINNLRASGEYDCKKFVEERFHPQVIEKITELSSKDYYDRLVYCPYNEADNAIWFGTPSDDGTWMMFDDDAKFRFYDAWKETYNLIRSIDSEAVIGGPGYCDYDSYEIKHFLEYCKANNCLPDIMIYHELGETSALYLQDHVDDYRSIENELGISEMPIIITEYGTMYECGAPADMLKYVVNIEKSGVYGNVAYWRLANNLCDTAADNNSPNSNWWLFRWYADMEGSLLDSKIIDIFHADFANAIKYGYDAFHYKQFTGIASLTESKDKIEAICGGCDYTSGITFKNLNKTDLGKKVNVKIECVYYEGISGIVNSPITVAEYTDNVVFGKLRVDIKNPDPTAVYHVVITEAENKPDYFNNNLPVRYEFENGIRTGGSYTYDSAYATTGEQNGMVGGLENIGDSVEISFDIPESGYYDLKLIYGNSNDGKTPEERKDSFAEMTFDGAVSEIAFPNTIKSEYTDKLTFTYYLEKGSHSMKLSHKEGTFVVDSLLISPHSDSNKITVLDDDEKFLAVAPVDGFYNIDIDDSDEFTVDAAKGYTQNGKALVYLRKGLNSIVCDSETCIITVSETSGNTVEIKAGDMMLNGSSKLEEGKNGAYINNISSLSGSAEFTVDVPKSGDYRMTVTYANNDEGGVHSYNVDLIERYITVESKGKKQTLWCRNTYSWDTLKTATLTLSLDAGENTIKFSNDGSVKFNNRDSYAPHIYFVSVNSVS